MNFHALQPRADTLVPNPGPYGSENRQTELRADAPIFEPAVGRSEGCGAATGIAETVWPLIISNVETVNGRGNGPLMGRRPPGPKFTKRSYLRACRRALCTGVAWYRGGCLTPSQVPQSLHALQTKRTTQPPSYPKTNRKHVPKQRLNVLHWNSGGLASERYQETLTWLSQHHIDIVVMSETRWGIESEWQTDDFWVLHHGTYCDKSNGLMVLISKRLCPSQSIKWASVVPGRLLHIRCCGTDRDIDLVACYQHVHTGRRDCEARAQWWQSLDTLIQSLPRRNTLVVIGDLNTSVPDIPRLAGSPHYKWNACLTRGSQHPDSDVLGDIMKHHQLVALTTFNGCGPSYVHSDHSSSRIDHVLVRHNQADGRSKHVTMIPDAPILGLSQVHHVPFIASIPKYWIPYPHKWIAPTFSYRQRVACRQDKTNDTDTWKTLHSQSLANLSAYHDQLSHPDQLNIEDLHQCLKPPLAQAYPQHQPRRNRTIIDPLLANKWDHMKALRRLADSERTASVVLIAWYHVVQHERAQRTHRHVTRAHKKRQASDLLEQTQALAENHDTFGMFRLISQYAPKTPPRRVQLRNQFGHIAHPSECLAILSDYVSQTWSGVTHWPHHCSQSPGVPFTAEELHRAIVKMPQNKSVASPWCPHMLVSALADELTPMLYSTLQTWWCQFPPVIPQCWKDAWVAFLPKPTKSPTTPGALRAIALMEPMGKAVVGILKTKLLQQVLPELVVWPQFAYIPTRGTTDAIAKVLGHCQYVKELVALSKPSVHHRALQPQRTEVCGGVQLSLDLSRAFDSISRPLLFAALATFQISDDLLTLLQEWHMNCQYHICEGGETHPVSIGRGIRQGCRIAPTLWAIFMAHFLRLAGAKLGPSWVKRAATIFADDIHLGYHFTSVIELHAVLQCFGTMTELLESLGLVINATKSKALIHWTGPKVRQLKHEILHTRGQITYLKVPRTGQPPYLLPLTNKTIYLGISISYGQFAADTMQYRVKAAQTAFARLKRWLTGKRGLSIRWRIRLWYQSVWTVLTYGLLATGLTTQSCNQFHIVVTKMIRRIAQDPAHITHHTNQQVFANLALCEPRPMLLELAVRRRDTIRQRSDTLTPDDALCHIDHSVITQLIDHLTQTTLYPSISADTRPGNQCPTDDRPATHHCPMCDFHTADLAHLKRHCTITHKLHQFNLNHIDLYQDTINGLPQCSKCHRSFTTWRSFHKHVGKRTCEAASMANFCGLRRPHRDPEHSGILPGLARDHQSFLHDHPLGDRFASHVAAARWRDIREDDDLRQLLRTKCALCGMWFGRPQELQTHWKQAHPINWGLVGSRAVQLVQLLHVGMPCNMCDKQYKTHHLCPTLFQISLLQLYGLGRAADRLVDGLSPDAKTCLICNENFVSETLLRQHLNVHHKFPTWDWSEPRDSLASTDTCKHCHREHSSKEALRRHITMGACPTFDPTSSDLQLPVDPDIQRALHAGTLEDVLTEDKRGALTLTCASCGKDYARIMDIMAHFQTAHYSHYSAALQHAQLIHMHGQPAKCHCHPRLENPDHHHMCPVLIQVGLQYAKSDCTLMIPWQYNDSNILQVLTPSCDYLIPLLHSILQSRDFAQLWRIPVLLNILSTTCILCGLHLHQGEIWLHLVEQHGFPWLGVTHFIAQLGPFLQGPSDHSCDCCRMIYNIPGTADPVNRQATVAAHYKAQCPVAVQLATILAAPIHGRSADGREGRERRGFRAIEDRIPAPLPSLHKGERREDRADRSPSPQEAQGAGKPCAGEGRSQRQRVRRDRAPPCSGAPCPTPRGGDTNHKSTRQLRLSFERRQGRAAPGSSRSRSPMGTTNRQDHATPSSPLPANDPGAPETLRSGQTGAASIAHMEQAAGATDHPERWLLAQAAVAARPAEVWAGKGSVHSNDTNAELDRRTPGDGRRPCTDPAFLQHAAAGLPEEHGSMEAPAAAESRSQYGGDDDARTLHDLDVDGRNHETPYPSSVDALPAGLLLPWERDQIGERQRQIQAQQQTLSQENAQADYYRRLVLHANFLNNDSWCYMNAVWYVFLWGAAAARNFQSDHWGQHASTIQAMLTAVSREPALLNDLRAIAAIHNPWIAEQGNQQSDATEFLQYLLQQLALPQVDNTWERRVVTNQGVEPDDQNVLNAPINLQMTIAHMNMTFTTLQPMIDSWSGDRGMVTALMNGKGQCCFTIDRNVQTVDKGTVLKCRVGVGLEEALRLPAFEADGMSLTYREHTVISAAAHLGGGVARGHYRAALKINPSTWCITDDGAPPALVGELPTWFAQNATVLWTCPRDQILWPLVPIGMTETETQIMQALGTVRLG